MTRTSSCTAPTGEDASRKVRLQKLLAEAGIGSRRQCEQFILEGRVTVDGRVVNELGTAVEPHRQQVRLDGEPVRPQRKRYFLINKPPGYVCTNRDPQGRPRAIDLVPQDDMRLFTVGRLDENSEGLLLVTNDGDLAHRLAHPRFAIPRIYRVQVAGRPSAEALRRLKRGLHFAEGKFRVASIRRVGTKGRSTFLRIVLLEGQNREIRRLLARIGHKVMRLKRIGFGPLRLGHLPAGGYRELTPAEVRSLQQYAAGRADKAGQRPKRTSRSRRRGRSAALPQRSNL